MTPRLVVAGMATMPSRFGTAPRAIESLLGQVDHLWLFLDRFEAIPDYAQHEKIRILRSQDHSNLKANGKFLGLANETEPCFYLSADDDILYPRDYAEVMVSRHQSHDCRVVVGLHGSVLNRPMQSYRDDRRMFPRKHRLWRDREVDVLGTDSICFLSTELQFDVRNWTRVNAVDLTFAHIARRAGVPLVATRRARRWVRELAINQPDSIYRSLLGDDREQTKLAHSLMDIPPPAMPRRRPWWKPGRLSRAEAASNG